MTHPRYFRPNIEPAPWGLWLLSSKFAQFDFAKKLEQLFRIRALASFPRAPAGAMPAALCEQACATIIHKVFKERLAYEVVGECVRGETHSRGAPAAVRGTQEEQGTPTPAPLLSRRHVGCSRRAVACVISRFVSGAGAGAAGRGGQVRARAPNLNARHGFCLQLRRWPPQGWRSPPHQEAPPLPTVHPGAPCSPRTHHPHLRHAVPRRDPRPVCGGVGQMDVSVDSGADHSGDRLHAQEGAIDRPVFTVCLLTCSCFSGRDTGEHCVGGALRPGEFSLLAPATRRRAGSQPRG